MKIFKALMLAAAVLLMTAETVTAGGELWMEDFAAAQAKASSENKDLLIDFTGSDWCGWCIKLDKEVFSTDEFEGVIHDHFVLVKLDYPKDKSIVSEEIQKQNAELKDKYSVRGYPTILLTDADGRPFAKTGYRKGGPLPYLEHLTALRDDKVKRQDLFAKAEEADELDRAKLLDAGLELTSKDVLLPYYKDLITEIIELDSDDNVGLKAKYEALLKEYRVELVSQGIQTDYGTAERSGKWDELQKKMDEIIEQNADEKRLVHQALFFKGISLVEQENHQGGIDVLEEARKADPEGGYNKYIPNIIKQVKAKMAESEHEGEHEHDHEGEHEHDGEHEHGKGDDGGR